MRLLHLAATTTERQVDAVLRAHIEAGEPFDYARVQAMVTPALPPVPTIHLPVPDLTHYDALLVGGGRC